MESETLAWYTSRITIRSGQSSLIFANHLQLGVGFPLLSIPRMNVGLSGAPQPCYLGASMTDNINDEVKRILLSTFYTRGGRHFT